MSFGKMQFSVQQHADFVMPPGAAQATDSTKLTAEADVRGARRIQPPNPAGHTDQPSFKKHFGLATLPLRNSHPCAGTLPGGPQGKIRPWTPRERWRPGGRGRGREHATGVASPKALPAWASVPRSRGRRLEQRSQLSLRPGEAGSPPFPRSGLTAPLRLL